MTRAGRRRVFLAMAGAALGPISAVAPARAAVDAVERCAGSYERAQELRRGERLLEARAELHTCAEAACPAFIFRDCRRWLREVEGMLPSVVLSARQGGRDLERVKVQADGRLMTERLDGRALPIDPGKHAFTFTAAGAEKRKVEVVIVQGKKNQIVAVELSPPPRPTPAPPAAPPPPTPAATPVAVTPPPTAPAPAPVVLSAPLSVPLLPPPPPEPPSAGTILQAEQPAPPGVRPMTLGLVATGALGLAGFAGFGIWGWRGEQSLGNSCAPDCSADQVNAISHRYLAADVSLGVGLAALAAAAYLHNRGDGSGGAPALTLQVGKAPGIGKGKSKGISGALVLARRF
jgi:hypothetical protein